MATGTDVRKRKDDAWRVRALLTVPDWAIISLLSDGKVRSAREIYSALGKGFTRKTILKSIRTLSIETGAITPQHIRSSRGYEIGFSASKPVLESFRAIRELNLKLARRKD